jgi:hypothetical protein
VCARRCAGNRRQVPAVGGPWPRAPRGSERVLRGHRNRGPAVPRRPRHRGGWG